MDWVPALSAPTLAAPRALRDFFSQFHCVRLYDLTVRQPNAAPFHNADQDNAHMGGPTDLLFRVGNKPEYLKDKPTPSSQTAGIRRGIRDRTQTFIFGCSIR